MPDITMCMDMTCSQKEQCYRYKTTPTEYRQSYFVGSPCPDDGLECDYFLQMENENETTQTR